MTKVQGSLARAVVVFVSTHCLLLTLHAAPQALTARTWGPKFATAGTNLEIRRVDPSGKSPNSDGAAIYSLKVSGFEPSQRTVDLWIWRVGREPQVVVSNLQVKNGAVVCGQSLSAVSEQAIVCAGDDRTAEVTIPASQGEPVSVALVSRDEKARVFAKIVPFPFEVGQGTCHMSLEREDQGGTLFVVSTRGLRPNESFNASMISENEQVKLSGKADSTGVWRSMVSPVVKGKSLGAGSIHFKSQSCELQLNYHWGTSTSPK